MASSAASSVPSGVPGGGGGGGGSAPTSALSGAGVGPSHAHLHHALHLLSNLRAQTTRLWTCASEGAPGDEPHEKRFLGDLKANLEAVNANLTALDTTLNSQTLLANPLQLGHSVYLALDDGGGLYPDLVGGYKWMDKARSVAFASNAVLGANSLNRSYGKMTKNRRKAATTIMMQPRVLDDMIGNLMPHYPTMRFKINRPNDTKLNAIVEISLERVLRAVIVFKGVMFEWVVVRGFVEDAPGSRKNPTDGPDVWKESKFKVFRKITQFANAAMLHYHHPMYPEHMVKSFIVYLHSFKNIFTDRCKKCGLHLHNNLPPTWRDFKTLDPYHEDCRPSAA